MPIKDKAIKWYIKNIEMPKREVQDHAGFMGENMGDEDIFLRDVALPEQIFVEIEERIDEPELLYRIGKQFSYRYAANSGFKQYPDVDEEQFRKTVYMFIQYMESVSYAGNIEYDIRYDDRAIQLDMENYIICRKSGKGCLFPAGGATGFWAYLVDDLSIEGVKTACQGRGDDQCTVITGPPTYLDRNGLDYAQGALNEEQVTLSQDYSTFNRIRNTDYAESSFKDFKDRGFFDHSGGILRHNDTRYLWLEASLIHLLGSELGPEHDKTLYDITFRYGKELAAMEAERNGDTFIVEYLSACGWGDTYITEQDGAFEVQVHLFPWTSFWEDTSFPIYRGLVSGLLTGYNDREVHLETVEKDMKGDGFTVIAAEQ